MPSASTDPGAGHEQRLARVAWLCATGLMRYEADLGGGHGHARSIAIRRRPLSETAHPTSTGSPALGPVRIPRQAVLRPLRHPGQPRRRRHHGRRRGRRRRAHRLPGRGQGAGAGRRPRQGRRHQAGRQRRRGAHARRQHPRHGHQGPHGRDRVDRARLRHRRGVLRQLHPRPLGQEAPRHAVGRGRRRDRGGGRPRTPTPSPRSGSTRSTGSTEEQARAWVAGRQAQPRRPPTARSTSCSSCTRPTSRATPTWSRSTR